MKEIKQNSDNTGRSEQQAEKQRLEGIQRESARIEQIKLQEQQIECRRMAMQKLQQDQKNHADQNPGEPTKDRTLREDSEKKRLEADHKEIEKIEVRRLEREIKQRDDLQQKQMERRWAENSELDDSQKKKAEQNKNETPETRTKREAEEQEKLKQQQQESEARENTRLDREQRQRADLENRQFEQRQAERQQQEKSQKEQGEQNKNETPEARTKREAGEQEKLKQHQHEREARENARLERDQKQRADLEERQTAQRQAEQEKLKSEQQTQAKESTNESTEDCAKREAGEREKLEQRQQERESQENARLERDQKQRAELEEKLAEQRQAERDKLEQEQKNRSGKNAKESAEDRTKREDGERKQLEERQQDREARENSRLGRDQKERSKLEQKQAEQRQTEQEKLEQEQKDWTKQNPDEPAEDLTKREDGERKQLEERQQERETREYEQLKLDQQERSQQEENPDDSSSATNDPQEITSEQPNTEETRQSRRKQQSSNSAEPVMDMAGPERSKPKAEENSSLERSREDSDLPDNVKHDSSARRNEGKRPSINETPPRSGSKGVFGEPTGGVFGKPSGGVFGKPSGGVFGHPTGGVFDSTTREVKPSVEKRTANPSQQEIPVRQTDESSHLGENNQDQPFSAGNESAEPGQAQGESPDSVSTTEASEPNSDTTAEGTADGSGYSPEAAAEVPNSQTPKSKETNDSTTPQDVSDNDDGEVVAEDQDNQPGASSDLSVKLEPKEQVPANPADENGILNQQDGPLAETELPPAEENKNLVGDATTTQENGEENAGGSPLAKEMTGDTAEAMHGANADNAPVSAAGNESAEPDQAHGESLDSGSTTEASEPNSDTTAEGTADGSGSSPETAAEVPNSQTPKSKETNDSSAPQDVSDNDDVEVVAEGQGKQPDASSDLLATPEPEEPVTINPADESGTLNQQDEPLSETEPPPTEEQKNLTGRETSEQNASEVKPAPASEILGEPNPSKTGAAPYSSPENTEEKAPSTTTQEADPTKAADSPLDAGLNSVPIPEEQDKQADTQIQDSAKPKAQEHGMVTLSSESEIVSVNKEHSFVKEGLSSDGSERTNPEGLTPDVHEGQKYNEVFYRPHERQWTEQEKDSISKASNTLEETSSLELAKNNLDETQKNQLEGSTDFLDAQDDGDFNVKSALENIANDPELQNAQIATLAKIYLSRHPEKIRQLSAKLDLALGNRGSCDSSGKILTINGLQSKEQLAETLLHEVNHAVTLNLCKDFEKWKGSGEKARGFLTDQQIEAFQRFEKIREAAINKVGADEAKKINGLANLEEFLSEGLTNKEFQGLLADIPASNIDGSLARRRDRFLQASNLWVKFKIELKKLHSSSESDQKHKHDDSALALFIDNQIDLLGAKRDRPDASNISKIGTHSLESSNSKFEKYINKIEATQKTKEIDEDNLKELKNMPTELSIDNVHSGVMLSVAVYEKDCGTNYLRESEFTVVEIEKQLIREPIFTEGMTESKRSDEMRFRDILINQRENFGYPDSLNFKAEIYEKNGQHYLAFRGTEMTSVKNWLQNIKNAIEDEESPHYQYALNLTKWAKEKYPDLILCGHSLGGGVAQYCAAKLKLRAVGVNSASVRLDRLTGSDLEHTVKNIANVNLKRDLLTDKLGRIREAYDHLSQIGMQIKLESAIYGFPLSEGKANHKCEIVLATLERYLDAINGK